MKIGRCAPYTRKVSLWKKKCEENCVVHPTLYKHDVSIIVENKKTPN